MIRLGLAAAAAAFMFLSGCGEESSGTMGAAALPAGEPASLVSADDPAALQSGAAPAPVLAGAAGSRASFADVPDRGDLVAYPADRVVRTAGAYTWHLAGISEEHALGAIGGVLKITAPSGELLQFAYQRHVEHPSGDWTWVGRALDGPPGAEAILTFGANAVFGNLSQPQGTPLRLTSRDGQAWLVETDAARLARLHGAYTDPGRPDFLVPAPRPGVTPARTALRPSAAGVAVTSAGVTIDVLVGYTTGFAEANGGASGAMTRINNLVEYTNQAYINSNVAAEVRLVHAQQVDYTDVNSNSDALLALTGDDGQGNAVFVPPALQALHLARETYGADLVALIRDFNEPENESCGIAWLLGGGLNEIQPGHEAYGFSIVSDGTDPGSDGLQYFCSDDTFAHELGHNLGAAHDTETAKGDDGVLNNPDDYGRFPYSFGYKTTLSNGNFYTIMAYGDSGQTGYRIFSNPDSTFCGGRACGVVNQADNARTLRNTTPIIASFRATVVHDEPTVPADYDGDGVSDVLWRNDSHGRNTIWLAADSGNQQSVTAVTNLAWHVVGSGDFDGDGRADILWRNTSTGSNVIWHGGSFQDQRSVTATPDTDWTVAAVADFDGDGRSDIFWRHATTGNNVVWSGGSSSAGIGVTRVGDLRWRVVGAGDFDGDGRDDVVWRNVRNGENTIWLSANSATRRAVTAVTDTGWEIVGVADFNGDDLADLLWRHATRGRNTIWRTGRATTQQSVATLSYPAFRVEGTGDYNGDGQADILWRSHASGTNSIWLGASSSNRQAVTAVSNLAWKVVP